jgi:type II secretory ATPase GspE/PulE/Tfp pilus assembly ATPase PilB-like protein
MSTDLPSIEELFPESKPKGQTKQKQLGAKLRDIKITEREQEVKKNAAEKNIPYINLVGFAIGPEALQTFSLEESKKNKIVCFLLLEKDARFAAVNPENKEVIELVKKISKNLHVKSNIYMVSEHSFEAALKIYERLPKKRKPIKGVDISDEELNKFTANIQNLDDFNKLLEETSTTDLLTLIIAAAVKLRASDIHLEPTEEILAVRFRIDGILHDIAKLKKERLKLLSSRIKILGGLKINVTNRPQDGRFTIYLKNDRIDVRLSALPTHYGESITMRLLMASVSALKLNELGLQKESLHVLEKHIKRPNGMIISTGPTGSGKTTTLYGFLRKIHTPERKIITIEDPIEYRLEGISQSQVNPEKDYTFAKGLKSLVRQDPDILMVGEMRDNDTAEIAIQSALTGHLLLTTLHTNQAAGAITRLLSLGAKPFLLAPALNLIIGQRLVRKLCQTCKKTAPLTDEEKMKVNKILEGWPVNSPIKAPVQKNMVFYKSSGCPECQQFGYWGRIGIFEILIVTNEIKDAILSKKTAEHQLVALAQKNGMNTIAQDGLLKAAEGITSVQEMLRVAGLED